VFKAVFIGTTGAFCRATKRKGQKAKNLNLARGKGPNELPE
jgi:hypothetical protein